MSCTWRFLVAALVLAHGNEPDDVTCWGLDDMGQASPPADLGDVRTMDMGFEHACAIVTHTGVVRCWGNDADGQASPPAMLPTSVDGVTSGGYHTCAWFQDGTVTCWGRNDFNQSTVPDGLSDIVGVTSGWNNNCAWDSFGSITCWGENAHGELDVPADIPSNVIGVSLGVGGHACAWTSSAAPNARCWGLNTHNQAIPGTQAYMDISVGANHSCALRTNGKVSCWGASDKQQQNAPGFFSKGVNIASGVSHSCGGRTGLMCWGEHLYSESVVPFELQSTTKQWWVSAFYRTTCSFLSISTTTTTTTTGTGSTVTATTLTSFTNTTTLTTATSTTSSVTVSSTTNSSTTSSLTNTSTTTTSSTTSSTTTSTTHCPALPTTTRTTTASTSTFSTTTLSTTTTTLSTMTLTASTTTSSSSTSSSSTSSSSTSSSSTTIPPIPATVTFTTTTLTSSTAPPFFTLVEADVRNATTELVTQARTAGGTWVQQSPLGTSEAVTVTPGNHNESAYINVGNVALVPVELLKSIGGGDDVVLVATKVNQAEYLARKKAESGVDLGMGEILSMVELSMYNRRTGELIEVDEQLGRDVLIKVSDDPEPPSSAGGACVYGEQDYWSQEGTRKAEDKEVFSRAQQAVFRPAQLDVTDLTLVEADELKSCGLWCSTSNLGVNAFILGACAGASIYGEEGLPYSDDYNYWAISRAAWLYWLLLLFLVGCHIFALHSDHKYSKLDWWSYPRLDARMMQLTLEVKSFSSRQGSRDAGGGGGAAAADGGDAGGAGVAAGGGGGAAAAAAGDGVGPRGSGGSVGPRGSGATGSAGGDANSFVSPFYPYVTMALLVRSRLVTERRAVNLRGFAIDALRYSFGPWGYARRCWIFFRAFHPLLTLGDPPFLLSSAKNAKLTTDVILFSLCVLCGVCGAAGGMLAYGSDPGCTSPGFATGGVFFGVGFAVFCCGLPCRVPAFCFARRDPEQRYTWRVPLYFWLCGLHWTTLHLVITLLFLSNVAPADRWKWEVLWVFVLLFVFLLKPLIIALVLALWAGFVVRRRPWLLHFPPPVPEGDEPKRTADDELSGLDEVQRTTVKNLARRGISVSHLLDFYQKLGTVVMPQFDPLLATTEDVVRQAIIPLSRQDASERFGTPLKVKIGILRLDQPPESACDVFIRCEVLNRPKAVLDTWAVSIVGLRQMDWCMEAELLGYRPGDSLELSLIEADTIGRKVCSGRLQSRVLQGQEEVPLWTNTKTRLGAITLEITPPVRAAAPTGVSTPVQPVPYQSQGYFEWCGPQDMGQSACPEVGCAPQQCSTTGGRNSRTLQPGDVEVNVTPVAMGIGSDEDEHSPRNQTVLGTSYAGAVSLPVVPGKMVTHTWSNTFTHLMATVLADAMGKETYGQILPTLAKKDTAKLRNLLGAAGKLENSYWIDAFSVNQHMSICRNTPQLFDSMGTRFSGCACATPKAAVGTPTCENDKMFQMMPYLSALCSEQGAEFGHVVAVDPAKGIFDRTWCLAELHEAHRAKMSQTFVLHSFDDLDAQATRPVVDGIDIRTSKTSFEEDKRYLLDNIEDPDAYNERVRDLVGDRLLGTNTGAAERMKRQMALLDISIA